jgi:hypothetical protein
MQINLNAGEMQSQQRIRHGESSRAEWMLVFSDVLRGAGAHRFYGKKEGFVPSDCSIDL